MLRRCVQLRPVAELSLKRNTAFLQRIKSHSRLRNWDGQERIHRRICEWPMALPVPLRNRGYSPEFLEILLGFISACLVMQRGFLKQPTTASYRMRQRRRSSLAKKAELELEPQ